MNKGILIIGGGILQIPALIRAKELGITTYLTDGSSECPAKPYADFFRAIDTKDLEGTAAYAVELTSAGSISAVYTQGTDVEYTVAYAAKKAGLFGIDPAVALSCNNKIAMRQILKEHGVESVSFASAKTFEEFKTAIQEVGFPLYVKPADNCASRGVTRLEHEANLETVFRTALDACYHTKEVLVESEISGKEYSVDTILFGGKLYPAGVSDRVFLEKQHYAVQSGSRTPSVLPEAIQSRMYEIMADAARALGVRDGAFKGDLAVDEQGRVRIMEITARTSGGFDSQYRKPYSFGIDLIKATMDIAFGLPLDLVDLIPKWVKWSSTTSIFPDPGTVQEIRGMEETKNIPGVRQVIMLNKVGDVVEPYINCEKRTNYIISSADTLADLVATEKRVHETLTINTK